MPQKPEPNAPETPEETPLESQPEPAAVPMETDVLDPLDILRDEMRAHPAGAVKLFRITPSGLSFLARFTPGTFTEEAVLRRCPDGGEFVARLHSRTGQYVRQVRFRMEPAETPFQEPGPSDHAADAIAQLRAEIAALREAKASGGIDVAACIRAFPGVLAAAASLGELIKAVRGDRPTLNDIVGLQLKQMYHDQKLRDRELDLQRKAAQVEKEISTPADMEERDEASPVVHEIIKTGIAALAHGLAEKHGEKLIDTLGPEIVATLFGAGEKARPQ